MGKSCCVPFCNSHQGDKSISFHEIPSKPEIRQKWLKVISRSDDANPTKPWIPYDRSMVCSVHFKEDDFKSNPTRRILKPDAVPSYFPGYPSYKSHIETKKRKAPAPRKLAPAQPKKRKVLCALNDFNKENVSPSGNEETTISDSPAFIESFNILPLPTPKIDITLPFKRTIKALRKKVNKLQALVTSKNKTIISLRSKLNLADTEPDEMDIKLSEIKTEAKNGDVKANILLEQVEAFGRKRFRWSELCVRMCILLKARSPRGYRFVRKYVANFPCESTLQRFIGPSNLQTGFSDLVRTRLEEEFKALEEREITCSLIFDEMAIAPRIVYSKRYDKVVGAAEYGKNVAPSKPVPANRLLCFVLQGMTTNIRIPVAYHLVKQLEGDDLARIILNVTKRTEEIGFRIRKLGSDDASINVKGLKIICGGTLLPEIPHPFRPDEPLFVGFDVCHILKNIRNQYLDRDRHWEKHGKSITSNPIKTLYRIQKGLPCKPVRFLTRKVVYPTNFEKMNVKRAVQIFSTEVISALEICASKDMHGFKNLDETLKFMKLIHKWFSILNVVNTTYYMRSRDDDKRPFSLLDDERLDWLENEFLGYLKDWKESVDAKGGPMVKGSKKATRFLTRETYNAIRITTLSSIACIKYLLQNGVLFVLTRKFTSDEIERLFGSVRAAQGFNDQANALGSLQALELILKTGLVAPAVKGNCKVDSELISPCSTKNLANITMPQPQLIVLNDRQKLLSRKLANPPDIPSLTTKNAGVAWIAGFLLKLLKDRHGCPEAPKRFTGNQSDKLNKLIDLQDRGGLLYPSHSFVCFVNLLLDILQCANEFTHKEALVKSWTLTLLSLLPEKCLECSCGDLDHKQKIRDIIVGHVCKLYFVNMTLDLTDSENSKPKGKNERSLSKKPKKVNN